MRAKDIINAMEKWADVELIDSWDNTGFQIGNAEKQIKNILIALDLDRKVLDLGIEENYDMIITHHPLIFSPLKSITRENYKGNLILDIIEKDILVYNAHSNLDLAIGGVNDILGDLFNLKNTRPLHLINEDTNIYGYGRVGDIGTSSILSLAENIKDKLQVEQLMIYGDLDKEIHRIAVCGGSGSDFILDAHRLGAQVYVTGDIKYHQAQLAYELGMTIIDPGHFHSEKIVLPEIENYLNKEFGDKINIKTIMESSMPHKIY